MTQEEKQLLLKDLCGRLLYGVLCEIDFIDIPMKLETIMLNGDYLFFGDGVYERYITQVKPYLRPMSSMTEEEKKEMKEATCPEGTGYFDEKYLICPMNHFGELISYGFMADILNWLNAHHFDYRSLIERGLALEAPEDMYNYENTI